MTIRKTIYFILSFLFCIGVFGQKPTKNGYDYGIEEDDYAIPFESLKTRDKIHFGFETGVGVGSSGIYGNYFSTYFSPQIRYDLSPRFSLNTGITYINSSVDNLPLISENTYQAFSGNISQYYAFVEGQYLLTDRLSVGGSIFYDLTTYSMSNSTSQIKTPGLNNLGGSAYFEYKVNKSFSIYGEIRVNDRNPYRQGNSRFSNGFMGAQGSSFLR